MRKRKQKKFERTPKKIYKSIQMKTPEETGAMSFTSVMYKPVVFLVESSIYKKLLIWNYWSANGLSATVKRLVNSFPKQSLYHFHSFYYVLYRLFFFSSFFVVAHHFLLYPHPETFLKHCTKLKKERCSNAIIAKEKKIHTVKWAHVSL